MTPLLIFAGAVAGVSHAKPDLTQLWVGQPVDLIPEPENEYDRYAVRVEGDGGKLGYLPKESTVAYHRAVELGFTPRGSINNISVGSRYDKIFIHVSIDLDSRA